MLNLIDHYVNFIGEMVVGKKLGKLILNSLEKLDDFYEFFDIFFKLFKLF